MGNVQGRHVPSMPLSMARAGEVLAVDRVKGAPDVKRHLETLGFVEGSQVQVVSSGGGNIIVAVKGSRFGLDERIARHVLVA